ncbi:hypothetical protein JDV02_000945 [Purpureocillium takamizusanense]|uniref:Uncharacterized protein n=1 Tax=Purpureocillium takamizusanense TaxID=2060973 RepID=A0A9Q8Q612_9HYPO|nr:uncharacterized protein JDV02_000945 [Purpureocillium takamizusanense]UNI14303.1 hypothetical protein JDV02_000945 [Purpureocillium takamizusanense]
MNFAKHKPFGRCQKPHPCMHPWTTVPPPTLAQCSAAADKEQGCSFNGSWRRDSPTKKEMEEGRLGRREPWMDGRMDDPLPAGADVRASGASSNRTSMSTDNGRIHVPVPLLAVLHCTSEG